jgi:hypothetical protein
MINDRAEYLMHKILGLRNTLYGTLHDWPRSGTKCGHYPSEYGAAGSIVGADIRYELRKAEQEFYTLEGWHV